MRHTALVSVFALFACGDTPDANPTDTDTRDTHDTMPDASEVIDDGSLGQTHLASTAVAWTEPLTLCSTWREGATLDAELAHKLKVTLAPQPRQGLTRTALDGATLGDIALATSPFAAGHHAPTATSTVSAWQVLRYESHDTLLATVTHTLGDLGTLEERFNVSRDGSTDPTILVTDTSLEVTFWWHPKGQTDAHILGPCAPPESWESAVESLVVERNGAYVTLLRFYRTPHSEITAGSYPVHLEATTFYPATPDSWPTTAKGFWAHTYVAQHHNGYDRTVVDFERDLGGWQTLFGPLANGEPPRFEALSKIEYLDVQGDKAGDVALTTISTTAIPNRTVWKVTTGPHRVDSAAIGRAFANRCATPVVGSVGYGDPLLVLVFCPKSGAPQGKELIGVVPVVWHPAPKRVGEHVTAIQPLSGRDGWSVKLDAATLTVEPQTSDAYLVDITVSGQSIATLWAELGPITPGFDWQAPVHARSADQAVELWIDRDWLAQGAGHTAIYGSPRVALRWGDRHDVVEAWDAIRYENTHHNWYDSLEATTLDGLTLHWKVSFDIMGGTGLSHTVWVTAANGDVLLPETAVLELDAR